MEKYKIEELKARLALSYNQGGFKEAAKETKEFKELIDREAKKRNYDDPLKLIDYFADHKEELIEIYPQAIEAYKLHLHPGINKMSHGLQKIKDTGIMNEEKQCLEINLDNKEYVRFYFKKDDSYENLVRSGGLVAKTFDFILWQMGMTQKCFFSCDLNDYFDFVGIKRGKKNIDKLSDTMSFLSNCDFYFKTTIKNKITNKIEKVSGFGRAFAWTLVRHDLENPKSKYRSLQVGTTPTWAETIINNKAFTKMDHKLPKISSKLYPHAYNIGRKLFERYRNNAIKRRGEETESISVQILIDEMNLSEKIKARGYPRQISQLEKDLNKLADDKIIEWRYKKRYKKVKDKAFGLIIYKPLSEDILSINQSNFMR